MISKHSNALHLEGSGSLAYRVTDRLHIALSITLPFALVYGGKWFTGYDNIGVDIITIVFSFLVGAVTYLLPISFLFTEGKRTYPTYPQIFVVVSMALIFFGILAHGALSWSLSRGDTSAIPLWFFLLVIGSCGAVGTIMTVIKWFAADPE
jgi:hypothetical protein